MTIGEALRKRRDELGLSANKAHMRLGISRQSYDAWEGNLYTPKPEHWATIAEFLDVPRWEIAVLAGILTRADIRAACRELNGKSSKLASHSHAPSPAETSPPSRKRTAA